LVTPTVDRQTDDLGVTPADSRVLMAQYVGDVPLWDEPGVPHLLICDHLARGLSPHHERHIASY
jgi:hypothetical protein